MRQTQTIAGVEPSGGPGTAQELSVSDLVVRLRAAGPDDVTALAAMLGTLSAASGFHRFGVGLGEPKPALLRALLACDAWRGAIVAVGPGTDPSGRPCEEVLGHACWSVDGAVVDVGVVVTDSWQQQGIGRRLVGAAIGAAAAAGATVLHLDVHPENRFVVRSLRRNLPDAATGFTDGLVTFDVALALVMPGATP